MLFTFSVHSIISVTIAITILLAISVTTCVLVDIRGVEHKVHIGQFLIEINLIRIDNGILMGIISTNDIEIDIGKPVKDEAVRNGTDRRCIHISVAEI